MMDTKSKRDILNGKFSLDLMARAFKEQVEENDIRVNITDAKATLGFAYANENVELMKILIDCILGINKRIKGMKYISLINRVTEIQDGVKIEVDNISLESLKDMRKAMLDADLDDKENLFSIIIDLQVVLDAYLQSIPNDIKYFKEFNVEDLPKFDDCFGINLNDNDFEINLTSSYNDEYHREENIYSNINFDEDDDYVDYENIDFDEFIDDEYDEFE